MSGALDKSTLKQLSKLMMKQKVYMIRQVKIIKRHWYMQSMKL